ncbi:MAG: hypothetical protein CMJ78_05895 [Planctomycetaceae bacterium]|nr:hypothetical protein [Planctomycetaceae bacterium]
MARIVFFEDAQATGLAPIALMRPVFELLCGSYSLRDRILRTLEVAEWGAFLRNYLQDTYREEQIDAHINDYVWLGQEPTLLINGRWLPDISSLARLKSVGENEVGIIDGTVVYLTLDPIEVALLSDGDWSEPLLTIADGRAVVEAGGTVVSHPWDFVNQNGRQIETDFQLLDRSYEGSSGYSLANRLGPQVAIQGNPDHVFVSPDAELDPFVVLDARHGPISIAAGAKLQPYTRLEGPCHIGEESQLFRTNLREGTTIGPVCRVGGEIEESIMHGYSNKYHDGFLGHSYVCPWVNLGALTTNSDLKNDYSNVKVPLLGKSTDTGSTKAGCFIGDHTKTALASLFNTGSSIGVMCMVLPGGELLPKHIPSFSRIWHGELDTELDWDSSIETARTALSRRNHELTSAQERLLRYLYENSEDERGAALQRQQQKKADSKAVQITTQAD